MPITAAVRSTTDDLCQELLLDGRHRLTIDEPEALGGTDTAPSPVELLAGALAGCVTVTLRMYARRKEWELGEIGVDVEIDKDASPPSCCITVDLPDGLDDERIVRLERIALACPVSRMLHQGVDIDHALTVGGRPRART